MTPERRLADILFAAIPRKPDNSPATLRLSELARMLKVYRYSLPELKLIETEINNSRIALAMRREFMREPHAD